MSSPGIVYNKFLKDKIIQSVCFNNLPFTEKNFVDIINKYKILQQFFANNKLIGPLPALNYPDLHILVYSVHLNSTTENIYLFYHIAQFPNYSVKLKEIEDTCSKWLVNFKSEGDFLHQLKNLSLVIGKIVFISQYTEKNSYLKELTETNLFIQQLYVFSKLSNINCINLISDIESEDIRLFLLETIFKNAWINIKSFQIGKNYTYEFKLDRICIKVITFSDLENYEDETSYIFFIKDKLINDTEIIKKFTNIFYNIDIQTVVIALLEKINLEEFEQTKFYKIITKPVGKSLAIVETKNKFNLVIESFNNYFNTLINKLI